MFYLTNRNHVLSCKHQRQKKCLKSNAIHEIHPKSLLDVHFLESYLAIYLHSNANSRTHPLKLTTDQIIQNSKTMKTAQMSNNEGMSKYLNYEGNNNAFRVNVVAHTCNPSYLWGWSRMMESSKPTWTVYWNLFSKQNKTKKYYTRTLWCVAGMPKIQWEIA